ncbi:ice-binding family protein [Sphaerisporangium sp. TRM90804]|uniref:ice-binding family protein n=1 Tax=Sphaerisporangium sp. TRM90804 TaxID=3031113 RepID=UPI0024468C99|nr:ice-binding family protein [Sphaerisporangium sp. TRM90804]MDH2428060.1 ice-binding family protein [Sphaerisporangium sp. TRM90804]
MKHATRPRVRPRGLVRSLLAAALPAVIALGVVVATPNAASAQTPVGLGTATTFAVLAGSAVTNTGPSVVTGDLGVSPGASVTGFPPGLVIGAIHAADAVATQAQADLTTAYNDAASRTPTGTVPTELGGTTLTHGVYNSVSGTFQLTGNLTLDAQGDPNAVFIFQTASTLVTASGSTVTLINGAQACNVFWQVGSSATLGTNSGFVGNILALTSITVTTGATVNGRLLARNGAVTLDTNVVTRADCQIVPPSRVTSTTVVSSNPVALEGTPVTFTALVTAASGAVPTGSVQFTSDGVVIGVVPVDGTGTAELTVSNLPVGPHQIVATYLGSPTLDASASPPLLQVIVPLVPPSRVTNTTVTSSSPVAEQGTPVTFTAVVTSVAGVPVNGSVQFTSDGVVIGVVPLDANGRAVLTVGDLPVGTHQIVATYLGSAQFDSSTATLVQVILQGVVPVPPDGNVPGEIAKIRAAEIKAAPDEECEEDRAEEDRAEEAQVRDKERAAKHRRESRRHHEDNSRLVTVRTLRTIYGVYGDRAGGHRAHHHSSRAHHHRGHKKHGGHGGYGRHRGHRS